MTYADSREGKPVILTAALTGGTHGKEANPQLPETPATIDEAAAAAEAAGASIVLLHARRENGELPVNSYNNPYQAVTDANGGAGDSGTVTVRVEATHAPALS